MGAADIGYLPLAGFYLILLIPILISYKLKLGNIKQILISVFRMTVQLGLVGLYLDLLFDYNKWWLNLIWLAIMLTVASGTVVKNAKLKRRVFMPISILGIAVGIFGTGAIMITFVVKPTPFYDAAHIIPIMGMLLGNCMRGNILALERFYHSIARREKEFITYLCMGASMNEASLPFLREAIAPALAPTLSTMATLGIVSLPGMMTGQILGGSVPITAIKYQIAIMIAIFTAIMISVILTLKISMAFAFKRSHILKRDIFLSA